MKKLTFILSLLVLIGCKQDNLNIVSEDELIDRIINNDMPDPGSVEIFNATGSMISLDSLKTLELTGEYFEDFYENSDKEILKVVIRKKTDKDKALISKITKELNQGQPLKDVEIDCNDKVAILQNLYDRDQGMRKGDNQIDQDIDHKNLEIVVSFLEKCGMPTLEEVDDVQMAGIWVVLQHSPAEYQSKYIPLLEESAKKGDIKWSIIALMKDRALMYEGKPQVYGSQISDGQLHELEDPEYVNQRRAEIGMEPLEDYLKRFDLEFDVPQKTR